MSYRGRGASTPTPTPSASATTCKYISTFPSLLTDSGTHLQIASIEISIHLQHYECTAFHLDSLYNNNCKVYALEIQSSNEELNEYHW